MADGTVGVLQATSPDRQLDSEDLGSGIHRERHRIGGATRALLADVKAASTAAVATDGALVVAISPNNTVPVSAASLPLPSGASTSAKQPALGTAGAASADVITVQGVASMTPLKVDGSAVTQPVSQATASSLNAQVVGSAASGASDAGNPVKVGGAFNTTQPTVTTGQRVDAQMTARGGLIVASGVDPLVARVSDGTTTAKVLPSLGTPAFTDPALIVAISPNSATVTDGINVAAVKGASTAAVATDKALVVSVSPNTTVNVTPVASTTSNSPAQQTVGTSSGSISASNAALKFRRVTNTGTTPVYLGVGQTPTVTTYHVVLAPCASPNDGTGGYQDFGADVTSAINAISSAATGTVCVWERT